MKIKTLQQLIETLPDSSLRDEVKRELDIQTMDSRLQTLKDYLSTTTFYTDPASTRHHLSVRGGLATHSFNVVFALKQLTADLGLTWEHEHSPEIIGLAHDMCKIGAYIDNPDRNHSIMNYIHNPKHPKGHGELSLSRVRKIIYVTDEEAACIRWHMGAFDTQENWSNYSGAIHLYPNVLWTHTADMMAAHIMEVDL